MILADTSVWIEHLRGRAPEMVHRLERAEILLHPLVLGELLLRGVHRRSDLLAELRSMPVAAAVREEEAEALIARHGLDGRGIGYVDVVLLASVLLTDDARLWTLDGRLRAVAAEMGIAAAL